MHDVYTRGQESQEPSQNSATIPIGQLPTGSLSKYDLMYSGAPETHLLSRHFVPAFAEIMPEGKECCSSAVLPGNLW